LTSASIKTATKMKGAKVRVERKTIHTADVDAFAILAQRCSQSGKVSILF